MSQIHGYSLAQPHPLSFVNSRNIPDEHLATVNEIAVVDPYALGKLGFCM